MLQLVFWSQLDVTSILIMLSPISIQGHTKLGEPLTPITALPTLPIEAYPRVLEPRERKWDYYLTLVVVLAIRSITPLSG